MTKVALTIFVILASALAGFASNSPCTQMTYDNYIAQGFACDIGDKTFSDFSYAYSSNPPGFGLPAGSLTAVPITTPGDPGFTFEGGWFASTSSGVLEQDSTLGFAATVNPGGALITDLSLFIEGVGFDGTGSIVVDETACWVRCCQLAPVEPSSNCGFATAAAAIHCLTLSISPGSAKWT